MFVVTDGNGDRFLRRDYARLEFVGEHPETAGKGNLPFQLYHRDYAIGELFLSIVRLATLGSFDLPAWAYWRIFATHAGPRAERPRVGTRWAGGSSASVRFEGQCTTCSKESTQ